jgi:predicted dehydrogenase
MPAFYRRRNTMKKIGFIDYYLEEWHARNYPGWIKKSPVNKSGFKVAYAWAERTSPGGISSEDWCKERKITLCASIEEVCEKSDVIVILSPDNAEKHLEYAQKVLPFKKATYMDKTFAPTLKEAREIFAIAQKYKTPLCSSSALRFSSEIADYKGKAKSITTLGPGPSFDTYAVHQLEIITKVMGTGAEKLMVVQKGLNISMVIVYKDGRRAVYNQMVKANVPFTVGVEPRGAKEIEYKLIQSEYFKLFVSAMIEYFETGRPLVNKKETLAVIALIEAGAKGLAKPDQWIDVEAVT